MEKIYDIIIIGAGPAGLAAGIYAGRARMDALVIEKGKIGGQILITSEVENYPGGMTCESGPDLIKRMTEQAKTFGAEFVSDTVASCELHGDVKRIRGAKGEYSAKTVIIATGAVPRRLGCPGEKELAGKGVSYCATCDGPLFEDMETFVVGGGDAALEEAMYIARFARKVTVINCLPDLQAAKCIQEKALANKKISFILDSTIEAFDGDGILTSMVVKNLKTGGTQEIIADEEDGTFGVFIFIGSIPMSSLFSESLEMDGGYIITDEDMHTNVPGVFAAGDIRKKSLRQVVTAAADGAIAVMQAEKYIEDPQMCLIKE